MDSIEEASSFRDPDGFVFVKEGRIYRQINVTYRENYELLVCSGLYESLVKEGLLIPHEECPISMKVSCNAYKVIQPEEIEFISYPYEWCFSQFKDAALCLLRIMEIALEYSMILKDASAYNIQFKKGKPVLIDTLSFTKYEKRQPWVAYRQFCQHFVAPLATMSQCDIRLSQLLRIYIDGLPLDLISKLLPFRSVLNFFLLSHVYLHARSQEYFAKHSLNNPKKSITLPNIGLKGIIQNLQDGIKKLNLKYRYSTW
ncbi:SAM-dependent methyltransferase, partial [bacterium]|nr:SAM-dependent methyltransferase [bacterium]